MTSIKERLILNDISLRDWVRGTRAETYIEYDPYVSKDAFELIDFLKTSIGQLVAVVGDQGTGKSTLSKIIADRVPYSYLISWGGLRTSRLMEQRKAVREVEDDVYEDTDAGYGSLVERIKSKIPFRADLQKLRKYKTILIDLGNYDKISRSELTKDVAYVDHTIRAVCEQAKGEIPEGSQRQPITPNFVVFVQKELYKQSFFFTSAWLKEILRLTPEEFVAYFHQRFPKETCFEDDALREIVILAKYKWRIIKEYMEKFEFETHKITIDEVHKVITPEVLTKAEEQFLADVYPKSASDRGLSKKVLDFLTERRRQKEIEKAFFEQTTKYPTKECSRMLTKLEAAGYIKSTRIGKEKYWERTK